MVARQLPSWIFYPRWFLLFTEPIAVKYSATGQIIIIIIIGNNINKIIVLISKDQSWDRLTLPHKGPAIKNKLFAPGVLVLCYCFLLLGNHISGHPGFSGSHFEFFEYFWLRWLTGQLSDPLKRKIATEKISFSLVVFFTTHTPCTYVHYFLHIWKRGRKVDK